MNQNYIKVSAESNPNVQMLQKYASRFGYIKKDTNGLEDLATRLSNRLNYLFENEDDYKYARDYITLPVFNILGKPYHSEEDFISYNGSFLHRLLQDLGKSRELVPRVCLIIHSRHLHAPLRGIFGPNSGYIAHYAPFIWPKSPTNWDAQLTETNYQTHPSTYSLQNGY